ncbi:helix-turn-helix domain-containing protein [Escherichia coli]|uniref:helix-turn-helix domain-containing protein n=1 Tax=Escherichia coli TaxID=562 RepID=UPI00320B84D2
MKVKGVPFSQVKQKLLNTPEAVKGYEDADKELEMVEMLYEMREKAGLTKSALAERMGLRPSAIIDWPPESPDNQYHLNK